MTNPYVISFMLKTFKKMSWDSFLNLSLFHLMAM